MFDTGRSVTRSYTALFRLFTLISGYRRHILKIKLSPFRYKDNLSRYRAIRFKDAMILTMAIPLRETRYLSYWTVPRFSERFPCVNLCVSNGWQISRGAFYWHGLTLIPAWISNHIYYKVWDEITYPFVNFNAATIGVWEFVQQRM